MRDLIRLRRRAEGCRPNPRLTIIDTQTVKCRSVRGPRGFNAIKGVVGRQRVVLVEANGNWLAVAVVPLEAVPPAGSGARHTPRPWSRSTGMAQTAECCPLWSSLHGMHHAVVARARGQKSFAVLPRRWAIERSFGWLTHWGGLLRNRAGCLDVSAAHIASTAALISPT